MVKKIIGGIVVLIIGGSTFAISQSDVVNNFSKNTGLSQEQAQQYVNNIKPSDLHSFGKIGQDLVTDGNTVISTSASIDCVNYSYKWMSPSLSCTHGKDQLQTVGNEEVTLGNCLQALDTNLGNSAKSKISECIADIDSVNSGYDLPIVTAALDTNTITNSKNSNAYNKSVLEAALQAK